MLVPAYGAILAGLGLAWLAGVGWQLQQPALWPQALYLLVLAGGALGLWAAARWRRLGWLAAAPMLAGAALAGLGATGLHAAGLLADALPAQLEGRDLMVTGVVASLPQAGAAGLRFRFDVEHAALNGQAVRVPRSIALGWYAGRHEDAALLQPAGELRAGQRWRFAVRLRQPHGNANPHGFDYELHLFEQGVRATGYVRDTAPATRLDPLAGHRVDRLRQQLRDTIVSQVSDPRAAGVLAALTVGDQAAIERDDWELFRNTGVAHLMSISGLHVTMFAWLAGLVVAAAWRRSARAMLWLPTPLAARWGGVLAALAYAIFAGWGVPAQRTVLMLLSVTLLQSLGRHWPWPLVLLAAAVVVTFADPWALLQPGFWLSFMAVGLLMSSAWVRDAPAVAHLAAARRSLVLRLRDVLHGGLRTQLIATIGLTPLSLVFFQQVSWVGFFANLLAIPLVTLVITPLALLGILLAPLWALAAWAVQAMVTGLAWLAAWPFAVWTVPAAPLWAQLAALLAGLLLVAPLPWRLRALAIPLALPLLLPPRVLPAEGQFAIVVADVGQGSSVLLRTRKHLLVYDAGPQYSRDSDAGQRVLLPLLRALGETRIDVLMLSHRDNDHVGGAAALLAALPVAQLHSSLEPAHALLGAGKLAEHRCEAGQRWSWDGVSFEVLHPLGSDYERNRKPNALSCVLRVQGSMTSMLLTGDIELEQEQALVASHGAALRSDLLLVPHHGSRTSSSAAFLDAVQPRMAFVQAGYRNRFGHPFADVMQRYRERGIELRESTACGAWLLEDGDAPQGRCQRQTARRYWHHAGASDSDLPARPP